MVILRLLLFMLAACVYSDVLPANAPLVVRAAQVPPPPSQDPFYKPPTGFANKAPGAILKYRVVDNTLNAALPNVTTNLATTYQILYRTTDVLGKPAAAVTTLFVPSVNPDPNKLVSYQVPYDSPDADCASSYSFRLAAFDNLPGLQASALILLMISSLNKGWYVLSPDYEGLNGALSVTLVYGQTTLDSIRAAKNSGPVTGIARQGRAVTWGYSGGGQACVAAAEQEAAYAPELNLAGHAFGGVGASAGVQNFQKSTKVARFADKQANALLGQAAAYPNMTTYLNKNLVASTAPTFYSGLKNCSVKSEFKGKSVASFFKNPNTAVTAPVPSSLYTWASALGVRGTPKAPMYFNEAINDELVGIAQADSLVSTYCNAGSSVQYVRNSANRHTQEGIIGSAGEMKFLQDRLNGVPLTPGCTTTDITLNNMPASQADILGQQVYEYLMAILQGLS